MKKIITNYKIIILLIVSLLLFTNAKAQTRKTSTKPRAGTTTKKKSEVVSVPPNNTQSTPTKNSSQKSESKAPAFNPSGFKEGNILGYIYDGRFNRINNKDLAFNIILVAYVNSFSNNCQSSLPKEKEEITYIAETYDNQIHTLIDSRLNIVGSYTTSTLQDRKTVGTGIFADPKFLLSYKTSNQNLNVNYLGKFLGALGSKNASDLDAFLRLHQNLNADINQLLTISACNSPMIKQFSENLLRITNSDKSIQEQNGEESFFIKECHKKLPEILPVTNANSCSCLNNEFKLSLEKNSFFELEDSFSFEKFLSTSFSKSGLYQKVSSCLK